MVADTFASWLASSSAQSPKESSKKKKSKSKKQGSEDDEGTAVAAFFSPTSNPFYRGDGDYAANTPTIEVPVQPPRRPAAAKEDEGESDDDEQGAKGGGGGGGGDREELQTSKKSKKSEKRKRDGEKKSSRHDDGGGDDGGDDDDDDDGDKRRGAPATDQDKLERTIFVGNVPVTATRKQVKTAFASYGRVESVRLRSIPLSADTKAPRKAVAITRTGLDPSRNSMNAYVCFTDVDSARAALAHNMSELGGRHVRVDMAAAASGAGGHVSYDTARTLFVGNLPFDADDEEVLSAFGGPRVVEAVRVVRGSGGSGTAVQGKGIAYVLFVSKIAAHEALGGSFTLRNRALRISKARKPSTSTSTTAGRATSASAAAPPAKKKKVKHEHRPRATPAASDHAKSWQGTRVKKTKGR
ncbi:nucleolar protein 12 [Pseudoscourfieldia marina]